MIRHIVAIRFQAGIPEDIKTGIYADLAGLSDQIEGIVDFRTFDNVSVELAVVRGFNDLFWFDFRDRGVRDTYLADPVHQAIGARIVAAAQGGIDGISVFDVEI